MIWRKLANVAITAMILAWFAGLAGAVLVAAMLVIL